MSPASTPERLTASATATAARSSGRMPASPPPQRPTGVRTADRITASGIAGEFTEARSGPAVTPAREKRRPAPSGGALVRDQMQYGAAEAVGQVVRQLARHVGGQQRPRLLAGPVPLVHPRVGRLPVRPADDLSEAVEDHLVAVL